MARIVLHGELGEKFGGVHRMNVRSPAEAIRALDANFKNFRKYLVESAQENVSYKIIVGDEELTDVEYIKYPSGRQTISFVPMIAGAGGKGFGIGEILVAAALVAVVVAFPESLAALGTIGGVGAGQILTGLAVSMALGGLSQMLAPHPKTPSVNNTPANVSSYIFNGPVNVTAAGAPVPVGYGRMVVGSVLVSGGVSDDPLPASLTPITGVTEILVPSVDLTNPNPQTGSFGGIVNNGTDGFGQNAVLTPQIISGVLNNVVIVNGGTGYHFPTAIVQDNFAHTASVSLITTNGVITGFIIGSGGSALDPATTAIVVQDNLVSGAGGGGGGKGGGGGGGFLASQDPTTLQSHSYASFVDLICEGEIGGLVSGAKSIYVNGTPIQNADGTFNFAGLAIYFTNGTQSQPVLPEVGNRVQNEVLVDVEVLHGVAITRTITDQTVTSARVSMEFPQITFQDPTNGDIHGTTVEIAIDVQTQGAGFIQVVDDVITGLCTSAYQRDYSIPLTGSPPWDIRVRRVTVDPPNLNTQNKSFWQSFTEIIDTNLRYVNSAVAGVMLDAAQFQSIPTRSYDCYLLKVKVPSNYDTVARTYAGIWDGTFKIAWTDNPAWAFYDMLTTARYGLGQYVTEAQVDKWTLYSIAQYCDQFIPDGLGGQRPRFTCNVYFQQQADAFKVIQDMASIFRGVAFWSNQTITARQDAPSDPIYMFSPSNITGLFTYAGASAKARHTVAYVTWNDPTNQYQQTVEYVENQAAVAKYGIVPVNVTALGATNRGQAHNVGKWLLYVEQNESETVTFKTGVEGSGVMPGVVILVSDPARAGDRIGGRVHAASTNSITIDSNFTPVTGSQIASITPDGVFQQVAITDQSSTTTADGRTLSVFAVSPNWTTPPQQEAQWVITQPNLVPQQFRVLSISDSTAKDGTYTIVAMAHNPHKYDFIEDDLPLEPLPIIDFTRPPGAVVGATLHEQLYVQNNVIKSLVLISWTTTGNSSQYLVSYSKDGGNYISLPAHTSPGIEIRNLDPGSYVFKIVAKDIIGHLSAPVLINYTVLGNKLPPSDVANFQITEEISDLLLTWNPNADVDLSGYEIRQGLSWDSGTVIVTAFKGTSFKVRPTTPGKYQYNIRAISTGGAFSANVTTAVITLLAPAAVSQFNVIQNSATLQFLWNANPEPDIVGYEIREGTSWAISTLVTQVLATRFAIPVGQSSARMFWIKAIRSPGIYSDTAEFTTTITAQVPNMNEVVSSDQFALGFPSQKILCAVSSGELIMSSGTARAEYIFGVNLSVEYNAINTVSLTLAAVVDDTITWNTATFTWDSSNAGRQWLPSGDVASVTARIQIARASGLLSSEVDGWDCASVFSALGVPADTALKVTYAAGRYNNGMVIGDFTTVNWPVSIPSVFSSVFWFQPTAIVDAVIWAVSSGSNFLRLGYSISRGVFYLEDNLGQQITLAYSFAANDLLFFGISQDTATRTLYIGNLAATIASASAAYTPIGTFSKINLHDPNAVVPILLKLPEPDWTPPKRRLPPTPDFGMPIKI